MTNWLMGSTMMMSASAPGAKTPFLGYKPMIFAGFTANVSTSLSRVMRPRFTQSSISGSVVSTPVPPDGAS